MLSSPTEKTKQIEHETHKSPPKQYTIFENSSIQSPIYMNRQFNTGSINVWVSQKLFYIQPKLQTTGINTVLKVDRQTQKVTELLRQQYQYDRNKQQLLHRQEMLDKEKRYKNMEALNYSLLIGIIDLSELCNTEGEKKSKKMLFLAEIVQLVCTVNLKNIYKILKPVYMFFNTKDKENLNEQESSLLFNLNRCFEQGMYYSYTYDLSKPMKADIVQKNNEEEQFDIKKDFEKRFSLSRSHFMSSSQFQNQTKQRQPQNSKKKKRMSENQQGSANMRKTREGAQFNWAQHMQRQLSNFEQRWSIPIIQGYVNKIEVYVNAQKFKLVLLSRRNRLNGGPLQFATGFLKQTPASEISTSSSPPSSHSSSQSSPANYAQTQLIFHMRNYYYSFVQIRGTVPLHWKYKYNYGMVSGIQFERTIEENYRNFLDHFHQIRNKCQYQNVCFVNLLESKNSVQKKLIQNFQCIIRKCQNLPGLTYTYYDLHEKCPQKNFSNLTQFLNTELKPILKKCSFSVFQLQNYIPSRSLPHKPRLLTQLHKQKGIIRTNCATCIDRTNIFQSKVAAYQLLGILQTLDIKINVISQNLHYIQDQSPFARLYRNMWADNGDAISEQYSGTNSMESVTVRMGKISYLASIDHGLTSLYRMVRNLREEDKGKWKAVSYLSLSNQYNGSQYELQGKDQKTQTSRSSSKFM